MVGNPLSNIGSTIERTCTHAGPRSRPERQAAKVASPPSRPLREGGRWDLDKLALAVGTLGFSEIIARDTTRVTVKDDRGNYWTGKQKS